MALNNLEKRLKTFQKKFPTAKKAGIEPFAEKIREFEDDIEDHHRWLKKILLIGSIIALLIVGAGLFFIFSYTSVSRDVTLEVSVPKSVSRGTPFSVEVSMANNSGGVINKAVITLNLPEGIAVPGFPAGRNLATESAGDIASGNLVKKTFSLLATGEDTSVGKISASVSYSIGTGTRFEVRSAGEVKIKGSAVSMEIKNPGQILSGSGFQLEVNYKNESDFSFSELILQAEYPNSFKFDSASVPPASLNNYWKLGVLAPGAKGKLVISGRLDLTYGATAVIPVKISAELGGNEYPIAEGTVNLSPSASPIFLEVSVNGREDYTAKVGETLNYSIRYRNDSGIVLADVKLNASLTGEMLDPAAAKSFYWNFSNLPALKMLDPGANGEVNFQAKIRSSFNLTRLNDRNFSVRMNAIVTSPSVPYYLSAGQTSVSVASDKKSSGLVLRTAQTFHNNKESGITDAGNLPPKVGESTQYSVHWVIKNFSNDLNNVEVRAALAAGVKWSGAVKANLGESPVFDEKENEVVWRIDRVAATKGVLSEPAEAVFQIEGTPNDDMLGASQLLLRAARLKALDNFTGLDLQSVAGSVTSAVVGAISGESDVVK